MAEKTVFTAVIGYGFLGKWHAEKTHQLPGAELTAIVESNPDNARAAKEKFPDAQVVDSLAKVMNDINAGIVVTPTSTHVDYCRDLLRGGKHVFCEKPLVSTPDEARELEELLAEQEGCVFQVGHSERCHGVWGQMDSYRELFSTPSVVKSHRLAPFKGRATDVDVVQDLMMHDLDLLLWLFKDRPVSINARGEKMRTSHWDFVHCQVEFEKDWEAYLTAGRNFVKEVRNLEVFHRNGALEVDLLNNLYRYADPKEQDPDNYVREQSYQKRDHLLIEQENFFHSIISGLPPMVSFAEGKKVVELNDAILCSLENGCAINLQG